MTQQLSFLSRQLSDLAGRSRRACANSELLGPAGFHESFGTLLAVRRPTADVAPVTLEACKHPAIFQYRVACRSALISRMHSAAWKLQWSPLGRRTFQYTCDTVVLPISLRKLRVQHKITDSWLVLENSKVEHETLLTGRVH